MKRAKSIEMDRECEVSLDSIDVSLERPIELDIKMSPTYAATLLEQVNVALRELVEPENQSRVDSGDIDAAQVSISVDCPISIVIDIKALRDLAAILSASLTDGAR